MTPSETRNTNINKRSWQLLPGLLILSLLAIPVPGNAVEIEAPKIALDGVPFEIVVSGVPAGAEVTLRVGADSIPAVADESGAATFTDLALPGGPPAAIARPAA